MYIFEIKNKKIKFGKYGYYKCPKQIETLFPGYSFENGGEHLLYTAILQYISNKYGKLFNKILVSIYSDGDIQFEYSRNRNDNLVKHFNINDFYLDSEKNILYKFENLNDKLSLNRKLKLEKIK